MGSHGLLRTRVPRRAMAPRAGSRIPTTYLTAQHAHVHLGEVPYPRRPRCRRLMPNARYHSRIRLCPRGAERVPSPSLRSVLLRNPNVAISAYVDDVTINTTGDSEGQVAINIRNAAVDLEHELREVIGFTLAHQKAYATATSALQATRLRGALARLAGLPRQQVTVRKLGRDYAGGRRGWANTQPVNRKRLPNLKQRVARIDAVRDGRAPKLFYAGPFPPPRMERSSGPLPWQS